MKEEGEKGMWGTGRRSDDRKRRKASKKKGNLTKNI